MTSVRVRDLVVQYGTVTALAASSFELPDGSATALIGANGSGKTTLLHVLAGLVRPTFGTVHNARADTTALVAQQHHQHRWIPLTVREVVRMGRYHRTGLVRRLRAHDRDAMAAAIDRADVGDLVNRLYSELSGGQQQRVRIAQALAGEPELLLLDEPMTGLDPPSQERILDIVGAERDRGTTVVYSTHHLDEARRADEVLVLHGSVLASGPPVEVLRADVLSEAFGGRVLVTGRAGGDAIIGGDEAVDGRARHDARPVVADGGEILDEGIMIVDDHGHDEPSQPPDGSHDLRAGQRSR